MSLVYFHLRFQINTLFKHFWQFFNILYLGLLSFLSSDEKLFITIAVHVLYLHLDKRKCVDLKYVEMCILQMSFKTTMLLECDLPISIK